MSLESDEHLMLNYGQRGDTAAFDRLYHRYRQPLFAFMRQKLPEAACSEVFQEVWESLIKNAVNYQGSCPAGNDATPMAASFKAYLYTIARRRIADYWRSQHDHDVSYDIDHLLSDADPDSVYQQQRDKHIILNCVSRLPKKQQDVFQLKNAGLKNSEMSDVLNSSFEAIKSRVKLAYKQLRECWEKHHDGEK